MIRLSFTGWARFQAAKQPRVIRRWLRMVARESEAAFKAGINGSHSGNIGKRRDGSTFTRSSPGEFPARDSGALLASLRSESDGNEAIVGTNVAHSIFLRNGTRFMARRRMSDDALRIGAAKAEPASRGWVQWAKGR